MLKWSPCVFWSGWGLFLAGLNGRGSRGEVPHYRPHHRPFSTLSQAAGPLLAMGNRVVLYRGLSLCRWRRAKCRGGASECVFARPVLPSSRAFCPTLAIHAAVGYKVALRRSVCHQNAAAARDEMPNSEPSSLHGDVCCCQASLYYESE